MAQTPICENDVVLELICARAYVKYNKDIPMVKKVCESKLNSNSSLFLISDIYREDLLVEIEGVFTI